MKKYLYLLLVLMFMLGCGRAPKEQALAKINSYEITKAEFEEEFKASPYSRNDTLASRREFLETLIDRKLILQDAQKQGLDKNKSFLKMIERFWEQSLLKLTLETKSELIVATVKISDKNIEEAYQKMVKDGKTSKTYAQMYSKIKWELTRLKETQMINDWIKSLRQKAQIKIDSNLLEKK